VRNAADHGFESWCQMQTTSSLLFAGGQVHVPTGKREAVLQAVALLLASCAAAAGAVTSVLLRHLCSIVRAPQEQLDLLLAAHIMSAAMRCNDMIM
jgi:hypothetical protein